jgi:large subunit ribosomal protein L4
MQALQLKSALIVTETKNDTLERSSRNVPAVKVLRSEGLNVYDILKYDTLVLLQPAIKTIEGRLTA